jgi:carbon storage regulator
MLVLTRKLMEKLYIGDAICVTVVRLEGGQVRLGIDAPREIAVVRAELLEQRRGRAAEPHAATAEVPALAAQPAPVTTRPVEARGIGIRRRGPSR